MKGLDWHEELAEGTKKGDSKRDFEATVLTFELKRSKALGVSMIIKPKI